MNTLPLRLAAIAMLSVSSVTAQDVDSSTDSPVRHPTKGTDSSQLWAAPSRGSFDGETRRGGSAGLAPRYSAWVEGLVRWTEQLVAQLDPWGVLESPFKRYPHVDGSPDTGSSNSSASTWPSTPRLRPIRLGDGYGVVARITF